MKITLFTANQSRHNYLANILSEISDECFVVQESRSIFPGIVPSIYPATEVMKKYFSKVSSAQSKIFGNSYINGLKKNIKLLPLELGDLNKCSLDFLGDFLKSDLYIVFGSSYIKGDLADFLIKNRAINIHMGVSPYYRGSDCNFWALYDDNVHLVGSTIHILSKGLDSGSILYHALCEQVSDPFIYTMLTVKSAFHSLKTKILDQSIFDIKDKKQDRTKEIRYSRGNDFTDEIVKKFFQRKINLFREFKIPLYKDPFFLKQKDFNE